MACQPATSNKKPAVNKKVNGEEPVAPQMPTPAVLAKMSGEDRTLLARLLSEPPAFIDHPELHRPAADVRLFGVQAKAPPDRPSRFPSPVVIAGGKASSSTRVPTLSGEQEANLFLRLNYTRKKLGDLWAKHAGKQLTLAAAHTLVAWWCWERAVRGRIVEVNVPLVLAMAKRTRLASIDFNEMVSEGNMALLRSVDKFDCGRGFKFSTYACRAILKSFSRVAMRASRYRGTFPVEFDPSIERSDHLEKKRESHEADCVGELKAIITRNAAELTAVEQTVIVERFALERSGPDLPSPKTLEQVGQIIGVTKERVRQIQNKALKKIRVALEEQYLAA